MTRMLSNTQRNFEAVSFGYNNLKAESHGPYDPCMVNIILAENLYLAGDDSPMLPAGTVIAEVCALDDDNDEIMDIKQAEDVALDDVVQHLFNNPRNIRDYMTEEEYELAVLYAGEYDDEEA